MCAFFIDNRVLARYPFLTSTREYFIENATSLEELLTSPAYLDARNIAIKRVEGGLEKQRIKHRVLLDDEEVENEILSYPMARMLVSLTNHNFIINRYALAESKSAATRLKDENLDFQIYVARDVGFPSACLPSGLPLPLLEELNNTTIGTKYEVFMHFTDYLHGAASFSASKWKMVNRDMIQGYIGTSSSELVRLIEEKLRNNITRDLPLEITGIIDETFRDDAVNIENKMKEMMANIESTTKGEYSTERFPPCVSKIMKKLEMSMNPNHEERFFLATFLNHVGQSVEEMIGIFSKAPDFDHDISKYQLEQIKGDITGTKYSPPACKTLLSKGLCVEPDELCRKEWMKHPLKYYEIKGKSRGGDKGMAKGTGTTEKWKK